MAESTAAPILKRKGDKPTVRTFLATIIIVGFFSVLALMMLKGVDADNNQGMFMLIGTLGTAFGMVVQFYFGSSAGSEQKNALLAAAAPVVPPKPAATPVAQPIATTQGVKQP